MFIYGEEIMNYRELLLKTVLLDCIYSPLLSFS